MPEFWRDVPAFRQDISRDFCVPASKVKTDSEHTEAPEGRGSGITTAERTCLLVDMGYDDLSGEYAKTAASPERDTRTTLPKRHRGGRAAVRRPESYGANLCREFVNACAV